MAHSSRIFKKYRIFPLICTGCLILALLTLVSLFIWTLAAYFSGSEPQTATTWAACLYLLLIFISCGIMTWLIRGGTVLPTLVVCLLAAIVSCLLSPGEITLVPALGKTALTLAVGIAGFTLVKLLCNLSKKKQPPTPSAAKNIAANNHEDTFSDFLGQADSGLSERL